MGKINRSALSLALASASLTALVAAAPAWGQAATADSGVMLEEIVVTARKRLETAQDVPLSITAFSAAYFERTGNNNLSQVAHDTPNLVVMSNSLVGTRVSVRGIVSESNNIGIEQSTGIFLDGIYQPRPSTLNAELLDIERIEVLRGPQGTLFGKNTAAGAINIVTATPSDKAGGKAELEVGNYGTVRGRAMVTGPLIDGRLAGTISAYAGHSDGWLKNTLKDENLNGGDRLGGRVKLLFTPSDGLRVLLAADYTKDDTDTGTGVLWRRGNIDMFAGLLKKTVATLDPESNKTRQDGENYQDRETASTSLTIDYELGDHTLTSISAYSWENSRNFNDNDYSELSWLSSGRDEVGKVTSQELRLASPAGGTVQYLVGLYGYWGRIHDTNTGTFGSDATTLFGLGGQPFTLLAHNRVDTDAYAAFGQATAHLTDDLRVTGGLRYTYESKDLTILQPTAFPGAALKLDPPLQRSRDEDDVTPMVSLQYDVTPTVMTYATYSRGYKSGGFSAVLLSSLNNLSFDAESSTNYEVGVKSMLLDRRLRLNASLFHMSYDDLQVQAYTGLGFYTTNAASAVSKGFELEASAILVPGLEVGGSVGYTHARYDSFPNAPCPSPAAASCVQDLKGKQLPYAPDWTTSLSAQYSGDLGVGGLGYVIRGEYQYMSRYNTSLDRNPTSTQDGYGLINARVGLMDEEAGWELTLWGRNLADTRYRVLHGSISNMTGARAAFFGEPVTYGVTGKVRF